MSLSLKILGEFALSNANGEALSLPTRKTRALLAYLAVNADRPQPRERLMTLLWGDRSEHQARQSLNQALRSIRRLGSDGEPPIATDTEHVTLRSDALTSDVAAFRAFCATDPACAAACYEGPLLDGLSLAEPGFEEWLTATRAALHARACDALAHAADEAAETGDRSAAIDHAARLVALDPLREDGQRRLIRLRYEDGDRAGALRQYQLCAETLARELQVDPDATTQALFAEIRGGAAASSAEAAPATQTEAPLAPPDKPSIAVLPFENIGGDPKQDFFGEGIADDLITDLSRFHSLFVIARGSSFAFRGQALDTREIAARLGVRYVLEGSVRTHGARIRITAQLIDAETKEHIWAERYDSELEDAFAVQDEVTNAIVLAIAPHIDRRELTRAQTKPPENLDAWSQLQLGLSDFYLAHEAGLRSAAARFDKSTDLDPGFATAYAYGGAARNRLVLNFNPPDLATLVRETEQRLERALALDPQNAVACFVTGVLEIIRGHHDLAIEHVRRAVALNPSAAYTHAILGFVLRRAGRLDEANDAIDRAMRLSPFDPAMPMYLSNKTNILLDLERYEECAAWGVRATSVPRPHASAFLTLAAAYAQLDRMPEASDALAEMKHRFPDFAASLPARLENPRRFDTLKQRVAILRKAGLVPW